MGRPFDADQTRLSLIHGQFEHWTDSVPLGKGKVSRPLAAGDVLQKLYSLSRPNSDYTLCTDTDFPCCCDGHAAGKLMKHNAGILRPLPSATPVPFHNTAGHQRFREGGSAYVFMQS